MLELNIVVELSDSGHSIHGSLCVVVYFSSTVPQALLPTSLQWRSQSTLQEFGVFLVAGVEATTC
jgi:hypothetical protein